MKLTNEQFKRLKELQKRDKAKTLTDKEKKEYAELFTLWRKKNEAQTAGEFHPGNDFAWWNKEPSLMKDAANIASKYIAGKPVDASKIPFIVPGVLRVKLVSCYGAEASPTDPLNVWARDLYLKFFQKYRGASGFSASDLAITIFAENEVVKLIAKYERIYGVVNRYSKLNVNIPRAELAGLGITSSEADYLRNHLSDFRYDLNVLIRKAQRLCVPKDLSSIADSISLFGYEYMDHDSVRSQIIVFDLVSYLQYDESTFTTGGALLPVDCDSNIFVTDGSSNMCKYLDQALSELLRSDSVQNILANMVVWFGENAMLQFVPIPDDYIVLPVKSDAMLHKLHNIEVFNSDRSSFSPLVPTTMEDDDKGELHGIGKPIVFQYNDTIYTKTATYNVDGTAVVLPYGSFEVTMSEEGLFGEVISQGIPHVLDTYRADADPEVIVEGTLFKGAFTDIESMNESDDPVYAIVCDSLALYVCTGFDIISMTDVDVNHRYINYNISPTEPVLRSSSAYMAVIDWAPLFYYISNGQVQFIYGDIDNPVLLYNNDIIRLHSTILYSAFKSEMQVIK